MKKLKEWLFVAAAAVTLTQGAGAVLQWLRTKGATSLPPWLERGLTSWRALSLVEQISVVAGIVTIAWAAIGLIALLLRRLKTLPPPPPPEPPQEDSPPSFVGLAARPAVNTEGFLAREAELARLNQLVTEGKRVIWVTGPTQAGKTWLVSQWVGDNGDSAIFARFGMDEGPTLGGVLEGINSFLCRHGEQGFDAACKAPAASTSQRVAELVRVLGGRRWIMLLDSFERVGDDADIRGFVERLQSDLRESVLLIGSRAMLEWGDAAAELPVRGIGEKAGFEILAEQGVEEEHREALYRKVDGLPGALVRIGALVRSRGVTAATRDLTGTAADVGDRLLTETFDALSEGGQRLWAGVCLLPAPITRDVAREMCARDDFNASWDELARWKLLQMAGDRAELHPLARAAGERRLAGMAAWGRACGQRIAKRYAGFAAEKADDRDAIEAELENVLAAARLAFEYQEWEALWGMGGALDEPLMHAGRWTAREELLRLCADGAEEARNKEQRAAFTHNLGVALQQRGKLEEAEALYRESLPLRRELGNRQWEGQTLHQLGIVAQLRGKLEEAEDWYKQSLEIKREVGDRPGEAKTLHQLGMVAQDRGKLEEAENLYRQSLEIKREVGDKGGEAYTLGQLGNVALKQGDLDGADKRYKEVLGVAREMGDRPSEAIALHQLGMAAHLRRRLEEAEDWYKQSLEIEREMGDRPGEAAVLHQVGLVAQDRGKLEEAEDFYKQSLEIAREVGDRPGEAQTLAQMAMLAEKQGDLRVAVERMEKAVAMMEEMGLAEAERARGDLERLRKRLDK